MAILRSQRLAQGIFTVPLRDPEVTPAIVGGMVYKVPAGYRAIVRDWRIWLGGPNTASGSWVLAARTSGSQNNVYIDRNDQAKGSVMYAGSKADAVLHEGDELWISTYATITYWISGAVLPILSVPDRLLSDTVG